MRVFVEVQVQECGDGFQYVATLSRSDAPDRWTSPPIPLEARTLEDARREAQLHEIAWQSVFS